MKFFEVECLEGRFHEIDATNDVEAQQVIRELNQIKQTPQRVYPTVGIVAFTLEQRDLISAYILKLKQQSMSTIRDCNTYNCPKKDLKRCMP